MWRSDRGRLLLFLSFLALLLGAGAAVRDLTFPDELRYAEVAREMLERGDFLLPRFNYEVYADKPPLFFWLVAASMKVLGPRTFAVLLPSISAALLTILLTYLLGRELFDSRVGLAGAWVLGTLLATLFMAQVGRMDMVLTLLVTAVLYLFHLGLRKEQPHPWGPEAAFFLIGLALITKGPVGLILPLLTILLYLALTRRMGEFRRLRPGRGLLFLCLPPLLWLLPAGAAGGTEYLQEILLRQSAGRIVRSFSHARPFYYYLLWAGPLFLPWSPFLLLLLDAGVRKGLALHRREMRFPAAWVIGTLAFFSVISGKILIYLLPLAPGLALLVAAAFGPLLREPASLRRPWLFRFAVYLLSALCAMGAGSLAILGPRSPLIASPRILLPTISVTAAGALLLGYLGHRRAVRGTFVSTGVLSLLLAASLSLGVLPKLNPSLSLRPMAQRILAEHREPPRAGGYKVDLRYLAYYLHTPYRKINTPEELRAFLADDGGVLIVDLEDLALVQGFAGRPLRELDRFRVKGMTYLLLAARGEEEGGSDHAA